MGRMNTANLIIQPKKHDIFWASMAHLLSMHIFVCLVKESETALIRHTKICYAHCAIDS